MLSVLIPNHNEPNIEAFIDEVVRVMPNAEIVVQHDVIGRGKGWAIREALQGASGNYIAFIDGDGDIPPKMLKRLLPFLEDYDIVVGSKKMTNAPLHRKLITHLSRIYIRLFFNLNCDTQTGIKLFRREALSPWKSDGFLFDVEILSKAQEKGYNIIEVPIDAEITKPMSMRTLCVTFLESLKIWLHL